MAGPYDPFTPGDENPDQRVAPQQTNALQGFLSDPRGQAALLQAGLSLMGGRSWGDNPASQVARAVGSSGEAVRTSETEQRAAEEAQSRIAERKSRGGARGASQDLKEQALDIKRGELELKQQRNQRLGEEFQQRHRLNQQAFDGKMAILQSKLAAAKTKDERDAVNDEMNRARQQQLIESGRINDDYTRAQTEQLTTGPEQKQQQFMTGQRVKASAAYQKYRNNPLDPGPKMSYQDFLRQNYPDLATGAGAPAPPPATATQPGPAPAKPGGAQAAPAAQGNVPTNPATGQPFKPGDTRNGYRWNGGNFFDRNSWTNLTPEPTGGSDTEDDGTD